MNSHPPSEPITSSLDGLEAENFERKEFIPFNRLQVLFTHDKILELLQQNEVDFHSISDIAARVLHSGLRIFAILAKIHDIKTITRFIKADQFHRVSLDSILPLSDTEATNYLADQGKRSLFLRKQWIFLAPVFSEDPIPRELHGRTILPFLKRQNVSEGDFGKVYKVEIDASHHQLSSTKTEIELICKELKPPSDNSKTHIRAAEFSDEVQILSALRCLNHPNIIKLVAAFSKDSVHHFLLPVADGDMKKFLNTNYRLPGFETESQILGSLWGLCSALESVHDYFFLGMGIRKIGCHYDIKPDNILLRKGKLLLSDFGLSRLRETDEGSQSLFRMGATSYLAPECEDASDGFKPLMIGRASDIWSLGCILAELVAYLSVEPTVAPTRVTEFHDERRVKAGKFSYYPFHAFEAPNLGVAALLKHCSQDTNMSPSVNLLATVVEKALQLDPIARPTAAHMTRLLFHLTQQVRIAAIGTMFDKELYPLDLELEVEIWRLGIWADISGLNSGPLNTPVSTWFAVTHQLHEYERLDSTLHLVEAEARMIAAELRKSALHRPQFRLYYRLQKLQDELWDAQSGTVLNAMLTRLEEKLLNCPDFVGISDTLEPSRLTFISDEKDDSAASMQKLWRRSAYLKTMRDLAAAMIKQDHPNEDLHLDRKSWAEIKGDPIHYHRIAIVDQTNDYILIEKLYYKGVWLSRVDELLGRARAIASLRNQHDPQMVFPVLQCRGYYHDKTKTCIGFVYSLPNLANKTVPIDLATAIEKTRHRPFKPSLTRRYKLATTLVEHLLSFHRGGWLHKSVSAFNIICFPEAFTSIASSLDKPYFIGFNHSRKNDEKSFSDMPGPECEYQHPVYLKNTSVDPSVARSNIRYCQEFDYYSVGLVLLEIALWKPLSSITKAIRGRPEEMLEVIKEEFVPQTRIQMGDLYFGAVKHCLTAYTGNDRTPEEVRNEFNVQVVEPITRCRV